MSVHHPEALTPDRPGTRRFTADEIQMLAEHGVFDDGEPFELWQGELILVSPQSPIHATACDSLVDWLRQRLRGERIVRSEKPLVVSTTSLPEPDVALVRGVRADFSSRHPRGDEALLVVEIARTSQDRDRDKAPEYAAAGVPVYWVVDLALRRTEVFERPLPGGGYGLMRVFDFTEAIDVPGVDEPLVWDALLPRPAP